MKHVLVTALTLALGSHMADSAEAPLWDLAENAIPDALQSGSIQRRDNEIILKDGAAFAIPVEAFPDPKNLTVQVTASIPELVNHTVFTVMSKQSDQDDGFAFSMNYRDKPWWARRVSAVVNRIYMAAGAINGQRGPQTDTPYTFTVSVRNGFASFYIDDKPYKKCYMEVIPNQEPLWIGRNPSEKAKPMTVVISRVSVYGPGFEYVSAKEPKSEYPRGVVAGQGWALDIPKIEHKDWPKVLIYGDSISMGYRGSLIPALLEQQVYVFHCCHFVNGDVPKRALQEMAARFDFDAVVFNNGLHSLHWTAEAVPDQVVHNRMRDLAQCFKNGAPRAKTFYLMTTPHTAPRPDKDRPVDRLGDKNDVVIRLNRISAEVMGIEKIEIIDIYSTLAGRLELASGDGYHWQRSAYEAIAGEIAKRVLPVLGK